VHHVLRSGGAVLVTSAEEVLETVGGMGEHLLAEPRGPVRSRDRLDRRQQRVLEAVPVRSPAQADSIARTAGLAVLEVRQTLGRLEGLGLVRPEGGGWRLAREVG
jgi:DNA processing protein